MITEQQADRVLHEILNRDYSFVETRWQETWGKLGSENEVISRGIKVFEDIVPEKKVGVLYGWIDQAVLEIISIGPISELRERAMGYRADQGGDTGILTMDGSRALALEMSFERGNVAVCEYKKPEPDTPANSLGLGRFP